MDKAFHFYKESFEEFKKQFLKYADYSKTVWSDGELRELYDRIEVPKRIAGFPVYGFKTYIDWHMREQETKNFVTGIKCEFIDDCFLHTKSFNSLNLPYNFYQVDVLNPLGIFLPDMDSGIVLVFRTNFNTLAFEKGDVVASGIISQIYTDI